jgi:hypothetical protein
MRSWIVLFVACVWASCTSGKDAPDKPAPARVEQKVAPAPAPPVEASVAPSVAQPLVVEDAGVNEWVPFARKDDVPLCLFASDEARIKALFLKNVKKQLLRANSELYFGAFAPGCASQECVALPTLQCWVEREGETLVVHSRYSGEQHRERVCKDKCEEVTAGCPAPELPAGSYTVRYGDRTMTLKLPSVLREPCVRRDDV